MVKVALDLERGTVLVRENFDRLVAHDIQRPRFRAARRKGSARFEQPANTLTVVYDMDFQIDLARSLRRQASCVRVKVIRIEQDAEAQVLRATDAINKILRAGLIDRKRILEFDDRMIASTTIDIASVIDNNDLRSIAAGRSTDDIVIRRKKVFLKSAEELKESGDDLPVLETSVLDRFQPTLAKRSFRNSACEMLNRGIDPGDVVKLSTKIDSNKAAMGTMLDPAKHPSRDPGDLLRERYFLFINQATAAGNQSSQGFGSSTTIPVYGTVTSVYADLTARIEITSNLIDDEFIVSFELLDDRAIAIDAVSRMVDHAENVRIFNLPLDPPLVQLTSRSNKLGRGRITITQQDHRATSVVIYKKIMNKSLPIGESEYFRIQEIELRVDEGPKTVPIDIDSTNPIIFRCIPIGVTGELASVYTNVVMPPVGIRDYRFLDRFRHVSVIARIDKSGIAVEVREIPCGIAAMTVQRRDLTIHESQFRSIDSDRGVVRVTVDTGVKPNHVYEYRCVLYDKFGTSMPATTTATVEFVSLIEDLVDTNLIDQLVTQEGDDIDFAFTIQTQVLDTQLQAVKNLIDAQLLDVLFEDDLKTERDQLASLLAHRVVRFNLTTGEVEDFGVISITAFSDAQFRNVNSVKPLRRGNAYRYEVYALLRAPETMFEKLEKTVTEDNQTHTFKPAKFRHPLAQQKGNITTPATRRANHARDEFSFGRVGSIARLDVPIAQDSVGVTNLTLERLDATRIIIRWQTAASSEAYDHFMIAKEILGTRTFVGAAHNITRAGRYEFIHELEEDDMGAIRFFVIPILSSYIAITEASTEEIVIGDDG